MKIYRRYILAEFLRFFVFFLLCFYSLYILIDYAGHAQTFYSSQNFSWSSFFRYYGAIFLLRAEILVPIGLLLAFVKTTLRLNHQRELVAFLAGGISPPQLLRPLFLCGWAAVVLLYINQECCVPPASQEVRHTEERGKKNTRKRNLSTIAIESVGLEDGSILLYGTYDPLARALSDVFWVRSVDDLTHMETLFPWKEPPEGRLVDHFTRSKDGELLLHSRSKEQTFSDIPFQRDRLQSTLLDPDMQSLSSLWKQLYFSFFEEKSDRKGRLESAFSWKIAVPWLSLLALLLPAPSTLHFSRRQPLFLLYVRPLFTLLALYLFLDALKTVTNRQILPPFPTLTMPILGGLLLTLIRYRRNPCSGMD